MPRETHPEVQEKDAWSEGCSGRGRARRLAERVQWWSARRLLPGVASLVLPSSGTGLRSNFPSFKKVTFESLRWAQVPQSRGSLSFSSGRAFSLHQHMCCSFLSLCLLSLCFTFPSVFSDFLLATFRLCSGMPLPFPTTFDKTSISTDCHWSVSTFAVDSALTCVNEVCEV